MTDSVMEVTNPVVADQAEIILVNEVFTLEPSIPSSSQSAEAQIPSVTIPETFS